ncbi:unnamed protein product [Pieris macdunnoughi]|uniref:MADF domain-containing protein n=1 Tax=Pieris macdunnoughi TaxID=345717 RepID=A0A821PB26_9NEOP|nr:unnamed protein product [Pieris macdunnoughi]
MDEEQLIEYVRQFKVIYNPKCKEYKDQVMRAAIWEEIGEKMKQPPDKCKDEWTKLRNAYVNAMKRRKNKKSGQAAKSIIPWNMSKALKKLPKLEQSKIKLDLHTAISQAEIRILEAQDQIRRMPINVTRQIISQPQQQRLQSPVHTSTSMLSFPSTSTFAYTPTFTAPMEASTLDSEQQDSRLSAYYSDIQFSEEDN